MNDHDDRVNALMRTIGYTMAIVFILCVAAVLIGFTVAVLTFLFGII